MAMRRERYGRRRVGIGGRGPLGSAPGGSSRGGFGGFATSFRFDLLAFEITQPTAFLNDSVVRFAHKGK